MANVRGAGDGPSLWDRMLQVPPVIRYYFVISAFVTIGSTVMSIVPPFLWYLDWMAVYKNFRVLPLAGSFFHWGGLGLHTITQVLMLFRYGWQVETAMFRSDPAEFTWALIIIGCCILVLDFFLLRMGVLGDVFLFAIATVWSRYFARTAVNFMGLMTFQGFYLPFLLAAFRMLLKGGALPIDCICGILAGHLYYFVSNIYPQLPGKTPILFAPAWFRGLFEESQANQRNLQDQGGSRMGTFSGDAGNVQRTAPAGSSVSRPSAPGLFKRSGHSWGAGNRLGS